MEETINTINKINTTINKINTINTTKTPTNTTSPSLTFPTTTTTTSSSSSSTLIPKRHNPFLGGTGIDAHPYARGSVIEVLFPILQPEKKRKRERERERDKGYHVDHIHEEEEEEDDDMDDDMDDEEEDDNMDDHSKQDKKNKINQNHNDKPKEQNENSNVNVNHRLADIIDRAPSNTPNHPIPAYRWKYYVHYRDLNRRMDEWIDDPRRILSPPSVGNAKVRAMKKILLQKEQQQVAVTSTTAATTTTAATATTATATTTTTLHSSQQGYDWKREDHMIHKDSMPFFSSPTATTNTNSTNGTNTTPTPTPTQSLSSTTPLTTSHRIHKSQRASSRKALAAIRTTSLSSLATANTNMNMTTNANAHTTPITFTKHSSQNSTHSKKHKNSSHDYPQQQEEHDEHEDDQEEGDQKEGNERITVQTGMKTQPVLLLPKSQSHRNLRRKSSSTYNSTNTNHSLFHEDITRSNSFSSMMDHHHSHPPPPPSSTHDRQEEEEEAPKGASLDPLSYTDSDSTHTQIHTSLLRQDDSNYEDNNKNKVVTIVAQEMDEHEGLDEASLREHEEVTKVKNVDHVQLGPYQMNTWYFSPLPKELFKDGSITMIDTLYVCEFTLEFFTRKEELLRYQDRLLQSTNQRHPPGNEIYRNGPLSMFEVDGFEERIYCQNLCYIAKLFLDHKTLYYDVDPFLFYVLCEVDERGFHPVGYFSKEKYSDAGYNLACILTFPCHQRKGYGRFLISFSYELSKKEEKVGSPEKPMSDLGQQAYKPYWASVVLDFLLNQSSESSLSIMDISKRTSILAEDVIYTLEMLGLLKYINGVYFIAAEPKTLEDLANKYPIKEPKVDSRKLHWTPFITDVKRDKFSIYSKKANVEDNNVHTSGLNST